MPTILDKLPFYDDFTTVTVQGHSYQILPWQIVVWVSLGPKGVRELDPRVPRFPAILDTGFTDTFLIHEQQLRRFAGLRPEHLRRRSDMFRPHGRQIPIHAANIWMHRNQPGERDR